LDRQCRANTRGHCREPVVLSRTSTTKIEVMYVVDWDEVDVRMRNL